MSDFRKNLKQAINFHSMENGSDTPDFILADYLIDCLEAFDKATKRRAEWYDPTPKAEEMSTEDRIIAG